MINHAHTQIIIPFKPVVDMPWNQPVLHHDEFISKPNGVSLSKSVHRYQNVLLSSPTFRLPAAIVCLSTKCNYITNHEVCLLSSSLVMCSTQSGMLFRTGRQTGSPVRRFGARHDRHSSNDAQCCQTVDKPNSLVRDNPFMVRCDDNHI